MRQYRVFNVRNIQVGTISAINDLEAMKEAKKIILYPSIKRILSVQEEKNKHFADECEIWNKFSRHY